MQSNVTVFLLSRGYGDVRKEEEVYSIIILLVSLKSLVFALILIVVFR